MNTFYIARHGETKNNRAGLLSGWADVALSDTGLVPTRQVIAKLQNTSIDEIYASDLVRAYATAQAIAEGIGFTKALYKEPGLREVDYGEAANMPTAEAYKRYPRLDRDTHFVSPGGESLELMQARLLQTVNRLNDHYTDKTILLVAHSGTMAALRASCLGVDFGGHNISQGYPHEYLGRFTVEDGKITSFGEVV